jgi:hypothetical protein
MDNSIHLAVPAKATSPEHSGIVAHRRISLDGDVVTVRGLPVTSPEKTFLDLAASIPLEELVGVGDAMLSGHRDKPAR